MSFASSLAIFFLFWVAAAFVLLPFGIKTDEEVGNACIPGQAESAPHHFDIPRHLRRSSILAAVLFALYYANYVYGWVTPDMLDFYN